jgi:hypothetical protein
MTRPAVLCALVLLLAPALARSAPAPGPESGKADPPAARMTKAVKFNGFEADPKLSLQDALARLAELYDLPFDVNEEAFREEGIEAVLAAPVLDRAVPAMSRTTPAAVLRKVLARIPVESGATWMVRRDTIEITTRQHQRAEVWGPNYEGPFLPLVQANFDKRPLAEALRELAESSGFSVVLDARAGDKGKAPVTASFVNVPLDTAVRTLADMADLKSVLNDNVLYVSTEARAVRLRPDPNGAALGGGVGLCANGVTPGAVGGLGALGGGAGFGGGGNTPLLNPVRKAVFDKKPVNEALQEVLEGTGLKLVVDTARAGDKAKAPVTADLDNVPRETCLRVLADLADLKPVVLDNVVYLTTKENAKGLQEEQDKRDAARCGALGLGVPAAR